ncbi:MAG: thiamine diphosphokinase, partial [Bacteroidota bacterium]|nr:thiamine diphosphokinase [Bacteroidota bacterium]
MDPAQHVLLILGGAFPGEARALALAESAARIVCADSGAEHARKLGLNVHAIVGDFDSITPDTLRFFEARGAEILSRPDQQHDDFEKALEFIAATHTGPVVVLGATGLRSDHLISNLSVMLRMTDRFESLTANDDFASYRFLTAV